MKRAVRDLIDEAKNLPGWHTRERLVVFVVDDYGSVRLESRAARERLEESGVRMTNRFDRLDTVETRDDLEQLFETLASVADGGGRHAVFTPYVLTANPDFEALVKGSDRYFYEPVERTFERLQAEQPQAYRGAWELWREGTDKGVLRPQFHGREHVNVELLERQLRSNDDALRSNLANRSMVGLNDEPTLPGVDFTHAFGFHDPKEVASHREILADGLRLFEQTYGYKSLTFTPPALRLHDDLYALVERHGVRAIDKPLLRRRRIDAARHRLELNWLGRRRGQGHATIVRNVLFEPNDRLDRDYVGLAMRQIASAFRWSKPAIISSHRVNFCGHVDKGNRTFGLAELKRLLKAIVARWPDVNFIGADELLLRIEGRR